MKNMGLARGWKNWYVSEKQGGGKVSPPGVRHPINIRQGTTDRDVFREVFLYQDYRIDIPEPQTILDIGANSGYVSVYLSNRYPGAKILAVEPDKGNFEALIKNTADYPNIQSMNVAAWPYRKKLSIKDPQSPEWTRQVEQDDLGEIEGVQVGDLIGELTEDRVNLVKIDIEGAEKHLFADNTEWLEKVDHIVIELHDNLVNGCSQSFFSALSNYEYQLQAMAGTILVKLN